MSRVNAHFYQYDPERNNVKLGSLEELLALSACPASRHRNMLGDMEAAAPNRIANSNSMSLVKFIAVKTILLVALGVILGLAQAWAASRYYKPDRVAGFRMGLLHGALMPAALPGLLLGNDLPIYAPDNTGRPYNIGYILGINCCGTVFFGVGFWRPRGWRWDRARVKRDS